MTDLGEALDAFSGCKNIQTTEASNEEQPPAPPGMGKGNFEPNGKKKKTTQATDQGLEQTQPGKPPGGAL